MSHEDISQWTNTQIRDEMNLVETQILSLEFQGDLNGSDNQHLRYLRIWRTEAQAELDRREDARQEADMRVQQAQEREREQRLAAEEWFEKTGRQCEEIVRCRAAGSGPTDRDYRLSQLYRDYLAGRTVPILALYKQYA